MSNMDETDAERIHLEKLIRESSETEEIDFKITDDYLLVGAPNKKKDEDLADLIKDTIAFANSRRFDIKYIVLGVNKKGGSNIIRGVDVTKMIDTAILTPQLTSHIDGKLSIDFLKINIDNKDLAVFRISNCDDRPYLIKKDFVYGNGKKLSKCDGWKREGSTKKELTKGEVRDLYRNPVYDQNKISLTFSSNLSTEIDVPYSLPDAKTIREQERIEKEVKERLRKERLQRQEEENEKLRKEGKKPHIDTIMEEMRRTYEFTKMCGAPITDFSTISMESMSQSISNQAFLTYPFESEEKKLERLDNYDKYENKSQKVNLTIKNNHDDFTLEDIRVEVKIPCEKIEISPREYFEERADDPLRPPKYLNMNVEDNEYVIRRIIKQILNQEAVKVFESDLKLFIKEANLGKTIDFSVELIPKNKKPFKRILKLKIVDPFDNDIM
jgi:hypothetical protein